MAGANIDKIVMSWEGMDTESRFQAAANVIQGLPVDGPFQPSRDLSLKMYSLYKQATQGPCQEEKPHFFNIVKGYKWRAWKSLENMTKDHAMKEYVEELSKIVDTMSLTNDVESFLNTLEPLKNDVGSPAKNDTNANLREPDECEAEDGETRLLNGFVKEKFELVNGQSSKPLSSSSEDEEQVVALGESNSLCNGIQMTVLLNGNEDTDTEDEYSEPAETLESLTTGLPQNLNIDAQSKVVNYTNSAQTTIIPSASVPKLQQHGGGETGGTGTWKAPTSHSGDGASNRGICMGYESHPGRGLARTGSGSSGGRRGPGDSHRSRGLPEEVSSQLIVILNRIHVDLQAILTRLDTLETQTLTKSNAVCSGCKVKTQDKSSVKRWWPFHELSPRSTFFLLTWPLILRGALKLLLLLRSHRSRQRK